MPSIRPSASGFSAPAAISYTENFTEEEPALMVRMMSAMLVLQIARCAARRADGSGAPARAYSAASAFLLAVSPVKAFPFWRQ